MQDYNRFLEALFLSNDVKPVERSNLYHPSHSDFFELKRQHPIVAVGAYSLMPNHFHILLQELTEGGITSFMRKLGTSFAMYFNIKYEHVGNVFIKPFRSKHITDDRYLKQVAQYIHFNAAEIFEPEWKSGKIQNMQNLERQLKTYQYSSLFDYSGGKRPESKILNQKTKKLLKKTRSLESVIHEAAVYYANLPL